MKEFSFTKKRLAKDTLLGFNFTFASPDLFEFMARLGFDYVFVDAEHFSFDLETIQYFARLAELTDIFPIIRVPKNDVQEIQSYLETGFLGIEVPHVITAQDAINIVKAVKYPPLGNRGVSAKSRAANYGTVYNPIQYYELANEQSIIIPMIEDEQAVHNLPEILKIPEILLFDIGPSDLSMSMGFPGQVDHPKVKDMIKIIKNQILEAGKGYAVSISTVEEGIDAMHAGARLIEFNTNTFLHREAHTFLDRMRKDN